MRPGVMDKTQTAIYPSLSGKGVLITGGGSGIGAAYTRAFAYQGSRVAFVDIAEDASGALADELHAAGAPRPLFLRCDIRDIGAFRAAIDQARGQIGDISVLVNNAASDDRHKFEDVTPEYWDQRIAINLRHMFFAAQAVAPQMKRLGGG